MCGMGGKVRVTSLDPESEILEFADDSVYQDVLNKFLIDHPCDKRHSAEGGLTVYVWNDRAVFADLVERIYLIEHIFNVETKR